MKPDRSTVPFAFVLSFLACLLVISGCASVPDKTSTGVSASQEKVETTIRDNAGGAHVEYVVLEKVNNKDRVSIFLSDVPDFDISRESDDTLLVNLKGVSIPEGMQTKYDGGPLRNLRELTLYQETTQGARETYARMLLKRMVPYRYRDDGSRLIVDFDVSTMSHPEPATRGDHTPATAPEEIHQPTGDSVRYTGEKISLDFQDADIKSVFRLISEISGLNIVAGPDVKAAVSVHMKNVPWDQALDTILEVNGLGKKQTESVVIVLPVEQLKKAEEERQKKDVAQGRLKQVSIEAKIVEVTTTFSTELGVRWGGGFQGSWGGRNFAMGMGSASSGDVTLIPGGGGGVGFTSSNAAVNFPLAGTVAAPVLGMVLGTSKMILDAQLSALESNGEGKIISSPKVTTLDGETATIEQGEEIPLISFDDNGNPVVSGFKDALLSLKVTPTLTPAGRISIVVEARNDYADWETSGGLRVENPPINTSSVESTIVVKDGDTIVVGGVYKTILAETTEGVPWLSEIPVLGWLFKYKTVSKQKRELLIFITPRVIVDADSGDLS